MSACVWCGRLRLSWKFQFQFQFLSRFPRWRLGMHFGKISRSTSTALRFRETLTSACMSWAEDERAAMTKTKCTVILSHFHRVDGISGPRSEHPNVYGDYVNSLCSSIVMAHRDYSPLRFAASDPGSVDVPSESLGDLSSQGGGRRNGRFPMGVGGKPGSGCTRTLVSRPVGGSPVGPLGLRRRAGPSHAPRGHPRGVSRPSTVSASAAPHGHPAAPACRRLQGPLGWGPHPQGRPPCAAAAQGTSSGVFASAAEGEAARWHARLSRWTLARTS